MHLDHDCEYLFQRIDANPILYPRQKDMLKHTCTSGHITRSEYIKRTGVSESTAGRDLSELVLAGWLERIAPGQYVMGDQGIDHQSLHRLFHP